MYSGALVFGPEIIGTNNSLHRAPTITSVASGGFVVAWTTDGRKDSVYDVFAQRHDVRGAPLGGEFRVNSHVAGSQRFPTLAALTDGGFAAVWESANQDGNSWGVFGQRFDADGHPQRRRVPGQHVHRKQPI